MLRYLYTLFFVTLLNLTYGAEKIEFYHTTHISSKQGLPHSLVFDIVQSDDGFLWVATNNGLGRFDGYNFKVFRPQLNSPNNISGKSVSQLFLDYDSHLWLSIQGIGLNYMDLDREVFAQYYPNTSDKKAISGNNVQTYFQDSNSTTWIGTNKGLDYFDKLNNNFIQCIPITNNNENNIQQIDKDYQGRIWIRSNTNIKCFDTKNKKLTTLFEESGIEALNEIQINSFLLVNKTQLVFATRNKGIICYNIETKTIESTLLTAHNVDNLYLSKSGNLFFLAYHPIRKIFVIPKFSSKNYQHYPVLDFEDKTYSVGPNYCEDINQNIWISISEGLFKIYPDLSVSKIKSKNHSQINLLQQNINARMIDNMGNLWLSSERNGLVMIDLNQKQFTTYLNYKNENSIIGGDNIIMVYEDSKKNIWVGCHSEGITCFNPQKQTFKTIIFDPTDFSKLIYKAPAGITEDADGNIWVGFYDGGLIKIDPNNMRIENFFDSDTNDINHFEGSSIRKIIKDQNNNLWFATNSNGLVERNMKTGEFIYHSDQYEDNFQTNSHYRFLMQTQDGIYWTGTQNGGLGRYDKENHQFIHYTNDPVNKYSISGNTVYYIYEQNDSILWLGTDKGLNLFNRNTKRFSRFQPEKDGYLCGVYQIFADKYENLWLSGDCGVIKFNMNTHETTAYSKSDGLPSNEFNTTAGFQTSDGTIYLGSSSGLVSFNPADISTNPYEAKPILTQLKIFNKNIGPGDTIKNTVILEKELSLTNKIVLPHYLNDFTIEFSSMHFASPLKNKYEYKLDGYNSDWIKTNANRRWANFTGLEPGYYVFHLKATNNDGVMCKSENEISLEIIIKPPFSKTWVFRIILILLLVFIGYMFSRIRLKNIRKQKHILEHTVKIRTKELRNKNELLEERQEEITLQKEELEKHRNHLGKLVTQRTIKLEAALKKAEESDQLKSAFLSNMSHEIRTPMNAILGFSYLLQESGLNEKEKNNFIHIISKNGQTLLNLLNDIIDISIIESGQLNINKRTINIHDIVKEIVSTFSRNNKVITNNHLSIYYSAPPLEIFTDPIRLTQILSNLISNAIKYTKEGEINISYQKNHSELTFLVNDTGIGIEKEKAKFIFDRFNKIEDVNNKIYRGGGLGLSICKNLVEVLGGRIWVESEPGKGSTFYFTIKQEQ